MSHEQIIFCFDIFGTVIFAITGALRGVHHRLDLLGVVVFGCTVGVGGGMLRDTIIGAVPVAALTNEIYLGSCILTGLIIFFIAKYLNNLQNIISVCDAIGLGVFTAIGAAKGMMYELHPIGIVLSGVLTAVGGGIIRDVMVREIPQVLVSDFYATASLIGGILYCLLTEFSRLPSFTVFLIVLSSVTGLRLAAMHYKFHLPVAQRPESEH